MNVRTVLVAGLLALLAGASVGGVVGYRMAWGAAESARADALEAATKSASTALQVARAIAADEQRRAVAAAEARGRRAAAAQEVKGEVAADLDLGCEWRADHRMRIGSIYSAYGFSDKAGAIGVRAVLPGAAADDLAAGTVGGRDTDLGTELQGSAQ